jgi:polyisoprenoid-binding protein YceI
MTIERLLYVALIPAALLGGATAWIPSDLVPVRYAVAPTGNEARFKVREQLVGVNLPNDAVGVTQKVTGSIVIGDNGQPIAAESKIIVDVSDLKTDVTMRDGFIKRNTLQTEQYPSVEFVPTSFRGLTGPIPTFGTRNFDLVGNLKIKDQTRVIVWHVTAEFRPGRVTGSAVTRFNFADFGMDPPKAGRVLAVSNGVGLEYDFNLVAGTPAS